MSQAPATTPFIRRSVSLGTLILIASIAGCGGGGGSDSTSPAPSPAPAPATKSISTTVIDGALQNVKVCLDRNDNGSCDSEEPSAVTNASGQASLEVPEADAGKYPILALVTKDSVDADTGAVPVAFMLRAPADQPGVVSPLSTLVQAHSRATGSSTSDAAAAIQSQLGLGASALADFTQDGSNAGKLAATMARLIVVTTQTQLTNTAGATGVDGAPLTSVQLNAAVNSVLLQQLQTLATAVLDNPALSDTSTSMKDKQSAMETAAQQVASASGVTAGNVGLIAAMQSQSSSPEAGGPAPSTQLRWLSFSDTSNYYIRAFEATAEQNTPDANGKRYFTEFRERVAGGLEQPWTRPQVYWTGSEWFACPTDFVQQVTSLASGETESLYCKSLASRAKQSVRNITGLKMRDIVTEIRSAPWQDAADGSFASWGPRPDQVPAETTFPSGSTLSYRTVTDLGGSDYYLSNNANRATIARADAPNNPDTSTWRSATLAEFIAWNAGDFAPNVSAAEVHGNNSRVLVGRRDYLKPDGSAAYKRYMVGFENGGEQRARFYECEGDMSTLPNNRTLFINGVSTCKTILVSNYSIATQADAKVLRFTQEPTQLNVSNFQNYRLFVERGGITYVGYRDKQMVSNQQRLNGTAADALLAALGLN
ncbi:hypothetical protein [Comamonas testosteroni]|uniref:Uncharacterized protein n=1 Tax=Comamonas testosteroni TaxID=285 RepID=A0A8B4RZI2_COMTE|nr:hypothetical protein [Comamonas testosteroni]EHN66753.1 hypothetical protein CTATCC11996_06493 [Comamonas testosteroni ATCC 11996]QQN70432.1 hypothetical protein IYN88_03110 [Comamonas testosteroni]SUY75046.1 Uncharacterised protein [Comamonas testosteroni]